MPNYKDLNNKVHWLDDAQWISLLPIGCLEITQEEADAINNPPPSFADLQESKRKEIRTAYATMECDNFTDANLVVWSGGEISATRLYGAYNLAKETGQASVVFYDNANLPHTLLLADAIQVVVGVTGQSRVCFDKKQALMIQIEAATTQAELDLIFW